MAWQRSACFIPSRVGLLTAARTSINFHNNLVDFESTRAEIKRSSLGCYSKPSLARLLGLARGAGWFGIYIVQLQSPAGGPKPPALILFTPAELGAMVEFNIWNKPASTNSGAAPRIGLSQTYPGFEIKGHFFFLEPSVEITGFAPSATRKCLSFRNLYSIAFKGGTKPQSMLIGCF